MLQDEAKVKVEDQLHQLMAWKDGLDQRLRLEEDSTAHVHHLDTLYHMIHVVIANYMLRWPEREKSRTIESRQELLFTHALASMESVWQYRSAFSFQYSTGLGVLGPIIASYSLIRYLRHRADISGAFSRAVQALREHGHLEIIPFLLAGLRVLERRYSIQMPQDVQGYMKVLDGLSPDIAQVPMEMPVIAHHFGDPRDGGPSRYTHQSETMSDLLKGYTRATMEQLRHGG